ncbi:MAG: exo-alpha-sialidase [Massilia sp.]
MNTFIDQIKRGIVLLGCAAVLQSAAAATYEWGNVAIGGGGFVSGIITSKTEKGLIYARTDVGGAYRWDKNAARWIPLNDSLSDKETGLLGIESIAIDPQKPNRVYMMAGIAYLNGGNSAILKSEDYGKSFSKINVGAQFKIHGNGMGRNTGERLQVDLADSDILYAGTRANGLFKSIDAGLTWRHLDLDVSTTPNKNGIGFIVLDPASVQGGATRRLFAAVSRYPELGPNLYLSADAGKSFSAVPGGPAKLMPQRAVIAGDSLIITYANGAGPWGDVAHGEPMDQGQVWKYTIASGRWTNISPPLNRAYAGISADPRDPKHLIVSTIDFYGDPHSRGDKFFTTTDGGASWSDVFSRGFSLDPKGVAWIGGSFIHWTGCIEFDPFDTKTVMVVSGNGIYKTANIDASPAKWEFNVAGLEETVPLNLVSIPGGPLISAIGDYDGFRHDDVSRYAPIHMPTMGTTHGLAFAANNPGVVARVGSAMYLSRDMGLSWSKTAALAGKSGQLALGADGKTIVHSPENSTTSFVSDNAGKSWTPVAGLEVRNGRPLADPVDPLKFYALEGARLMVSVDAGRSFAPAATLPSANGSKVIRAAPGREGDLWLPLYDKGLARSTNSGKSVAAIANVTYAAAVGFGKSAAGADYPTVYIWGSVGGVRGMFRSTDSGASWLRINDDDHQYGGPGDAHFVVGDMNAFGVVYMSTAGRGIVVGKPSPAGR